MGKRKAYLEKKYEEQDGNCGICHEKMSLELKGEWDKVATLDHIIPISKLKEAGLKKSFMLEFNTWAVHMGCNRNKSDKPLSFAIGELLIEK